jgi:nitroreductase
MEDIRDALQIAMKTPTVCNRQAIKVRYIRNKKIISDVLKLQGGVIGYETPPFLLFITVEDSAYLGANERNQGFIDGGLFVMSVLYGLEYKGLAACALNAAFTEESEVKMREMIDIPDGEKFITFISVGHFNESNNICRSFRYPLDSVISEVTELYETTNTRSVAIKQKDTLRGKLKIRARAKEALSLIKHKTRVRTRLRNARENIRRYARERSFAHPDGGIITLIDYNNYGNILQRYALQEFLYQNDLAYVSYEHDLPIASDINDPRFRYTADFVKRYVHRGTISESSTGRAYIVGSDQIWRDFSYDKPKEKIGFFFLNFIKDESARRIAYAASFGRNSLKDAKITPEISLYLKPYIQKFNAVSVREDAAVSIVKDAWNIEADVVIDPTMLLPKGIYSGLIDKVSHGLTAIDGVFSYLIGVSDENEQLLEKAYTAIGGTPYRIDLADYSGPLPQVEQWLLGLRDAKLAVVDSFHGTVFSIINNTNFIVLENKGSGMERMIHLLDVFGIKGRMITHEDVDSFVFEELQPIDWGFVNDKLEELRAQSGDWLLKAVQSDK